MEKSKECEGKTRCLKEINPEVHPGVFFGEGWKHNENEMACVFCIERAENEQEGNEGTVTGEENL